MALPLAPIALTTIRIGGTALAAYALARQLRQRAPYDQRAEEALDDLAEGVSTRADRGRADATIRWERTIRLGRTGPGLHVNLSGIGRLTIRKA